jgi:glycosyltransferase involved in cell wall biosynthesis
MSSNRKLVILNQAANYLTIGFANAFSERFDEVVLITGSVHVQGEELRPEVIVHKINKWHEKPARKKALAYALALLNMWWLLMTKYRRHEVFFVSVPPMGYLLNLIVSNKFSMVIWDVYPDVFKITGMPEEHWLYKVWAKLNERSFKKAFKLFTISEKMADLVAQYVNKDSIEVQPIWSIFQANEKHAKNKNPFISKHQLEGKFIVQYSGNIGLTHNVETLIEVADLLKEDDSILFQIIGRGPRKTVLERLVKERNLPNCQFLPFQSDEMFPYSLSAADIGVVILDETTSKGSVPSKSYNLMSYGTPSLYIASSDSQLKIYADKYNHGKCFSKSDLKSVANFLVKLKGSKDLQLAMSRNAEIAAKDFKRANADKFVARYLASDNNMIEPK